MTKQKVQCPGAAPDRRTRGRPPAFDRTRALELAMLEFWRHGYEGASIARLTQAMGINAPSLYAAFGSKESLYAESLQAYADGLGDIGVRALIDAADARTGVAAVLAAAARAFTRPGYPRGCMIGVGSLRCGAEQEVAMTATRALRQRSQQAVLARLERAAADGELPVTADPRALADFYGAVVEGMSVQAQDGASRARLQAIGQLAMRVWPAPG